MPRLRFRQPKYSHHKPSGQARVYIAGKEHWLGPYGTEESKARYDDLIERHHDRKRSRGDDVTVTAVNIPNSGMGEYPNSFSWQWRLAPGQG